MPERETGPKMRRPFNALTPLRMPVAPYCLMRPTPPVAR